MKNYILPEALGNEILNYLASRPYVEVFKMVDAMKKMNFVKEEEKDVEK